VDIFSECRGFEWDEGNSQKNWIRHGVNQTECEQLFLNQPLVVIEDTGHSNQEARYYALGQTDQGRRLFVVFTVRDINIRIISARDMSQRERSVYQSAKEETDTGV
jgi:uncharacterized DUF497 family protein